MPSREQYRSDQFWVQVIGSNRRKNLCDENPHNLCSLNNKTLFKWQESRSTNWDLRNETVTRRVGFGDLDIKVILIQMWIFR